MPGPLNLGLAGGTGAGYGVDAFREVLKRQFLAAIEQRIAEDADADRAQNQSQFSAMMPLRERGLAVDEGNLGVRRDELAAGRSDVAAGRQASMAQQVELEKIISALPPEQQNAARMQLYKIDPSKLVAKEEEYTLNPGDRRYRGTQQIAQGGPQLQSQTSEPLVAIMGPDGKPILVPRSQASGATPVTARKPVLGTERTALGFYNRALQASKDVEALEPEIAKMGLMGQTALEYAPNFLQSQTGQSYRQAQRTFTEARLRKESGAAIPKEEYANDAKTYFAQPGDSAETIAQKRAARQEVLDGIGFAAGTAFEEFYGEPFKRSAPSATTTTKAPGSGQLPPGWIKR